MKEYYGKSSNIFEQSPSKRASLLPALRRTIPQGNGKAKALDVGCGQAALFPIFSEKGYGYYTGVDISKDMLKVAESRYPKALYIQGSAEHLSNYFVDKFDVIVANMLFTSMSSHQQVVQVLSECKKLLKDNSPLIVGVAHPCFDAYMQAQLTDRKGVEAQFEGYYASGNRYTVEKEFSLGSFVLEDYHWTLADYVSAFTVVGFKLDQIDECKPDSFKENMSDNKLISSVSGLYPPYLVFVCK